MSYSICDDILWDETLAYVRSMLVYAVGQRLSLSLSQLNVKGESIESNCLF